MVNLKSKKPLILVGVGLSLIIALVVGFILNNPKQEISQEPGIVAKSLVADGPCSARDQGSILAESISPFLLSNYTNTQEQNVERAKKLVDLETRITKLENFIEDANCLHILTMIYIDRSDAQLAETYFTLLEKGLKDNNPDSYILDENANYRSLEQMRLSIETLKSNQEQGIGNNSSEDLNGEEITE